MTERARTFHETGDTTVMKFVVFEPCRETRVQLCEHLSTLGFEVAPFGDARVAFLFLLGRLQEIDGAIVNVGDLGKGRWLMECVELLEEPLAVVTYCELDEEGCDGIEESLHAAIRSSNASVCVSHYAAQAAELRPRVGR